MAARSVLYTGFLFIFCGLLSCETSEFHSFATGDTCTNDVVRRPEKVQKNIEQLENDLQMVKNVRTKFGKKRAKFLRKKIRKKRMALDSAKFNYRRYNCEENIAAPPSLAPEGLSSALDYRLTEEVLVPLSTCNKKVKRPKPRPVLWKESFASASIATTTLKQKRAEYQSRFCKTNNRSGTICQLAVMDSMRKTKSKKAPISAGIVNAGSCNLYKTCSVTKEEYDAFHRIGSWDPTGVEKSAKKLRGRVIPARCFEDSDMEKKWVKESYSKYALENSWKAPEESKKEYMRRIVREMKTK